MVEGYKCNHLDDPVLVVGSKPLMSEFGIQYVLESCEPQLIYFPHFPSVKIEQGYFMFGLIDSKV